MIKEEVHICRTARSDGGGFIEEEVHNKEVHKEMMIVEEAHKGAHHISMSARITQMSGN